MSITGQVVDHRGHALPGVIVEDSYTITFTHSGFTVLKHQIDRISNFVATINASLQSLVTARSSE